MILKAALLAAMVGAATSGSAHAEASKTEAPATPDLNARAERQLRGLFAPRTDAAVLGLFGGDGIIFGPFLWKNLESYPGLGKLGIGATFFSNLGGGKGARLTAGGSARTFAKKDSVAAFRQAFVATYPADAKARTRKPAPAELRLFAKQLPFPPVEPLFVVEAGKHKFIVTMNEKLQILAIDDLP